MLKLLPESIYKTIPRNFNCYSQSRLKMGLKKGLIENLEKKSHCIEKRGIIEKPAFHIETTPPSFYPGTKTYHAESKIDQSEPNCDIGSEFSKFLKTMTEICYIWNDQPQFTSNMKHLFWPYFYGYFPSGKTHRTITSSVIKTKFQAINLPTILHFPMLKRVYFQEQQRL